MNLYTLLSKPMNVIILKPFFLFCHQQNNLAKAIVAGL